MKPTVYDDPSITDIPPSDVSLVDFLKKWQDYDKAHNLTEPNGRFIQRLKIAGYPRVTLNTIDQSTADEIKDWLKHNIDNDNYVVASTKESIPAFIWFYTNTDAVYFRLAWAAYVF